jgi:hypothetical protein
MSESKIIKMSQEQIWERNNSKFALNEDTGVRKLTSTGCMERTNLTRDEQYLTQSENMTRNWEHRNRAEREEQQLQNALVYLVNKGARPRENDNLEEFILANRDLFAGDWDEFIIRLEEARDGLLQGT